MVWTIQARSPKRVPPPPFFATPATEIAAAAAPALEAAAPCGHLTAFYDRLVQDEGMVLVECAEGFGSGLGFLFDRPLPVERLRAISRPDFVHLIASRELVFCERCWQSLGEWSRQRPHWS